MQEGLTESDVEMILNGVRDSYNGQKGKLAAYKSTNTDSIVSLVIEADLFGTLVLTRDGNGLYNFADLRLDEDTPSERSQFYLLFNGIVKKFVGKEWLANNSMSRSDSAVSLH